MHQQFNVSKTTLFETKFSLNKRDEEVMTLYKEWIDFVTFPKDVERVRSEEARLNITKAVYVDSEQYNQGLGDENGFVVTSNIILFDDDKFEAMEINTGGGVVIWTQKRVWCLQNQGTREKLIYLPRHPEFSNC